MGYHDKVMEEVKSMEHRAKERGALWQAISESFESEGTDGIESCLSEKMDKIKNEFDSLLSRIEKQL